MSAFEDQPSADRPEPEDALAGSAADTPDHEPADEDDRLVDLDDPEGPEPEYADDDRDPATDDPLPPGVG